MSIGPMLGAWASHVRGSWPGSGWTSPELPMTPLATGLLPPCSFVLCTAGNATEKNPPHSTGFLSGGAEDKDSSDEATAELTQLRPEYPDSPGPTGVGRRTVRAPTKGTNHGESQSA